METFDNFEALAKTSQNLRCVKHPKLTRAVDDLGKDEKTTKITHARLLVFVGEQPVSPLARAHRNNRNDSGR
jgi:hypothetical protein